MHREEESEVLEHEVNKPVKEARMKFRCEFSNSQAHISPRFSLAITDKQHCARSLPSKTVD